MTATMLICTALGAAAPSPAAVLCANPRGAVRMREACRAKETVLQPATLGLLPPAGTPGPAGPQGTAGVAGPQGPQGLQGPAGPEARFALVDADGSILEQSGGITASVASDPGGPLFIVQFEDAIAGRPLQVSSTTTPSDPGSLGRGGVVAVSCAASTAAQAAACFDSGVRDDGRILVRTKAADGTAAAHAFYLVVF